MKSSGMAFLSICHTETAKLSLYSLHPSEWRKRLKGSVALFCRPRSVEHGKYLC